MLLVCTNRARSQLSSRIAVITLQVRRPKASSARFLSTTVHRSVQRSRRLSCPRTKVKKAWYDMTTPSPISRQKSSQSQAINPPRLPVLHLSRTEQRPPQRGQQRQGAVGTPCLSITFSSTRNTTKMRRNESAAKACPDG